MYTSTLAANVKCLQCGVVLGRQLIAVTFGMVCMQLRDTVFALVPEGSNPETFRHWEVGAIIVGWVLYWLVLRAREWVSRSRCDSPVGDAANLRCYSQEPTVKVEYHW